MKNLSELTGEQTREIATLRFNITGFKQAPSLFFVQLDDCYAVDNTGCIFQIIDRVEEDSILVYEGESGLFYNYAEDSADFEDDSEDAEIYNHCFQQAELLFES
jgi:hypothetical protein